MRRRTRSADSETDKAGECGAFIVMTPITIALFHAGPATPTHA